MADNFTANQIQGIFGEFKPAIDDVVDQSANNWQGIFGLFKPVLDEAAGARISSLVAAGGLAGHGGIAGLGGGLAG